MSTWHVPEAIIYLYHKQVMKVYDPDQGMLAKYGRPLKDVPLRMDTGDLVLVRYYPAGNKYVLAFTLVTAVTLT